MDETSTIPAPQDTDPQDPPLPECFGLADWVLPHRTAILQLADRHGASNVRVFGSVVRNQATANSDIDFLIDYDLARITPWFPTGLARDLKALLGRPVDVVPANSLHRAIRDRILQEAIAL